MGKTIPPSLGHGLHPQFWPLPAGGRALIFPILKTSVGMIIVFSSFRCLPEDPEIWDIPWKLCSSGVRGLHGNSEPGQDGVESSSSSQRERGPPSHIFLPRTWLLASADNPTAFPLEPPRSPPD